MQGRFQTWGTGQRVSLGMDAGAVSDWGRRQGSSLGMDTGMVSDIGQGSSLMDEWIYWI